MILPDNWLQWKSNEGTIHFIKLSLSGQTLSVDSTLTVNHSLHTKESRNNYEIPISLDVISDIRQIETLINEINMKETSLEISSNTVNLHIAKATEHIKEAINVLEKNSTSNITSGMDSEDSHSPESHAILDRLQFISRQLENSAVPKKRRRYNIITQVVSLKAHLTSPICYNYLQSLDCLSLPHHRNLQKLYTNYGIDDDSWFTSNNLPRISLTNNEMSLSKWMRFT